MYTYVSIMPTRRSKLRRAQLLDAAARHMAATSGARRGRPARARRVNHVPVRRTIQKRRIPRMPMTLSVKSSVDMWDPYGKTIAPPSATALGNFTTINGQTSNHFKVADTNVYVLLQWSPLGTKGMIYSFEPGSTTDPQIEYIYIPQIGSNQIGGGELKSSKPLRLSCYLLNGNKWPEGFVDALSIPEQFNLTEAFVPGSNPQTLTSAFAMEVDSIVSSHAKTRTYKGTKFNLAKRFVMGPASYIGYQQYQDVDDLKSRSDGLIRGSNSFAMTTCVIRFRAVIPQGDPNTQVYSLHTYSQDGCRYLATSALASMAKPQPSNPHHHQAYHEMGSIVSQIGSVAHDVADVVGGAALARYGPAVVSGARNAIAAGGAGLAGALGLGGGGLSALEAVEMAAPLALL